MDLQGKKVLLFTSVFFNYHIQIKKTIETLGAVVHLYDERNNSTSMEKILIRKAHFLMNHKINKFYQAICEKEYMFDPDYILFVSPEAVTKESMQQLKKAFVRSRFILYMWDSVENKKIHTILPYFDNTFSFDPVDCEKYGMTFRPLFFSSDFEKKNTEVDRNYVYDICFIGTVHSDRAKILWEIKEFCESNQLKYYFYLFIPGKLLYHLRMLTDKNLRKWDKSFIHIDSINKDEVARISEKTRCIVDINHPKQTGLTMRTIEMLGLCKKIATTNSNIRLYDFYQPQNQIVLDRKNLKLNKEMLTSDYQNIPDEIYDRYKIMSWAKDLFDINNYTEKTDYE